MNMMIKRTVAGVLLAAGTVLAAPAGAAEHYLATQLAISDVANHGKLDNGTSFVATYGMTLPRLHEYLGFELEYTNSVDSPQHDSRSDHAEFDYYTVAGYGVLTIPITGKVSLRTRAGLLYEDWELRHSTLGNESDTHLDLSISGGATYRLTPHVNLIGELTIIENSILHASAGAQFRF